MPTVPLFLPFGWSSCTPYLRSGRDAKRVSVVVMAVVGKGGEGGISEARQHRQLERETMGSREGAVCRVCVA